MQAIDTTLTPSSLSQTALPAAAPELRPTLDSAITIIGGGFCGTTALVQIIDQLVDLEKLGAAPPKLVIDWYDSEGRFGRGLPYQKQARAEDDNILILNQPAALMSPFADRPDAYSEWLARRHPEYGPDSFTPRSTFGEYLEEILSDAEERAREAGCRLTVRRRTSAVRDLGANESGAVIGAGGEELTTGSVIVASGHQRVDQFEKFAGLPGYLNRPFDVESYRALDLEKIPKILIIGGGPSSIDVIRVCESLGFRGTYQIVAAQLSQPWQFDPQLYSPESFGRFEARHLRPELLGPNPSFRELSRLLGREVREARASGFGPGHVYYGIDLAGISAILERSSDREGARQFGKWISFLRGNITPPENAELLGRLGAERRLRFLKGRAVPELSGFDGKSGSFRIVVEHRSGRRPVGESTLLVNCSLFPRAGGKGIAHSAKREELAGAVFAVGPALESDGVVPRSWGVETFRGEVERAARLALRRALSVVH